MKQETPNEPQKVKERKVDEDKKLDGQIDNHYNNYYKARRSKRIKQSLCCNNCMKRTKRARDTSQDLAVAERKG